MRYVTAWLDSMAALTFINIRVATRDQRRKASPAQSGVSI
jgi:hypothetical protein